MDNTISPKSFWKRPEGKTGMIFAGALGLGGLYVLYKSLPFLIELVQNTLHLGILLAVLGALVYVILDPKVRSYSRLCLTIKKA